MATVTSGFLAGVRERTWSSRYGGSLYLASNGSFVQPFASGDPARSCPWEFRPAGSAGIYTISEAVYESLAGGTVEGAPYEGTYVDASGVAHWLGVDRGAVLPSDPPPPPPAAPLP